jgi:hypothetical protein
MFGIGLGLGALGAGIFSSIMNRNSVRESNAANERLSWSQWHATNAYNHPKRQMQRFREAGLNPNLIYGQMSNVPPPASVRSTPVPGIDIGFDKLADYMQNREAFELSKANTEHQMLMSEAGLELQKQRSLYDQAYMDRKLSIEEANAPLQRELARANLNYLKARTNALNNHEDPWSVVMSDVGEAITDFASLYAAKGLAGGAKYYGKGRRFLKGLYDRVFRKR